MLFLLLAAALPETIIVPLAVKGKPDPAVITKINAELPGALVNDATVVNEKTAKKRAKETPAAAGTRCGASASCLASYGRNAKAERVLFGLASTDGKDVSVDFQLVSSLDGATIQRLTVAYPAGGDVKKITQENASKLMSSEMAEMPALQAIAPVKKKKDDSGNTVIAATPGEEPLLAPISKKELQRAPEKRSRALLWTGVALAVVGAAGMGAGTYFGVTELAVEREAQTATQPQLPDIRRRMNDSALFCNIGFGAGGGILAVGIGLIVADMIFEQKSHATLSVTATGASAGWVFEW